MPSDLHSPAVRARSRSETRADSANVTRNPRGTAQGSPQLESDSESGGGPCADRLHLLCPGCNKSFATISSLRRHRNSWWMTDPSCRAAGSQLKRPRTVRVHDSGTAQDAIDRINEMMGDGTNRGVPPGAAPDLRLQPRDEVLLVSDVQSQPKVQVYNVDRFVKCFSKVCTRFVQSLLKFQICLHKVCTGLSFVCTKILSVCTKFKQV